MSTDYFPTKNQWPNSNEQQQDPSKHYALSGKIMLTSIITLFIVMVILTLVHLYTRWYLVHRNPTQQRRTTNNRSTRIVYYINTNSSVSSATSTGLDASVLKSLHVFVYSYERDKNMPECAVCLSEFEEGETGRVLPSCKHAFHTGCIDMWFCSHSTCPLCRSPVEVPVLEEFVSVAELGSSGSLIETTVEQDRRKRVDVRIDVPDRIESLAEIESPGQGFKSPGSRLRSLKRVISMNRRSPVMPPSGVGPSCRPVVTEPNLESASQESSGVGH